MFNVSFLKVKNYEGYEWGNYWNTMYTTNYAEGYATIEYFNYVLHGEVWVDQ